MSEQDEAQQIIIPTFKLPTTKRLERACAACHYSVKEGADIVCRRMPPQLTFLALPSQTPPGLGRPAGVSLAIQHFCGFPIVQKDQWCGEFRPKGGDS